MWKGERKVAPWVRIEAAGGCGASGAAEPLLLYQTRHHALNLPLCEPDWTQACKPGHKRGMPVAVQPKHPDVQGPLLRGQPSDTQKP